MTITEGISMSCLTLWCCSDHTSRFCHQIYEIHCISSWAFVLHSALLSAIIRDKRLITNNLWFFPLLMDNYDKKLNCWHWIKPSKVIFAGFSSSSIYYGSSKKCETWNWLLRFSAFNMFFLSFSSFYDNILRLFFHFFTWHVHVSEDTFVKMYSIYNIMIWLCTTR